MVTAGDHLEQVEVLSLQVLHDWLLAHHCQREGVWLVTWKKHVAQRYVPHTAVLDELVAFGWTDGPVRRIDADRTRQIVSPRRTQPWARSYKDRAERLQQEGRLQPAGQAAVDAARASGAWDAMNDVDDLKVPEDLQRVLSEHPPAGAAFTSFPPSTRRSILRWIASAKTPDTRTRRLLRTATDAQRGVRTPSHG